MVAELEKPDSKASEDLELCHTAFNCVFCQVLLVRTAAMFFTPEVLKKKGKLFLVWIAATQKGGTLNKYLTPRKVLQVELDKTVNEILQIVNKRYLSNVLRSLSYKPVEHYSLYLSSKLMFGCCVLIRKQATLLFDDLHNVFKHLNELKWSEKQKAIVRLVAKEKKDGKEVKQEVSCHPGIKEELDSIDDGPLVFPHSVSENEITMMEIPQYRVEEDMSFGDEFYLQSVILMEDTVKDGLLSEPNGHMDSQQDEVPNALHLFLGTPPHIIHHHEITPPELLLRSNAGEAIPMDTSQSFNLQGDENLPFVIETIAGDENLPTATSPLQGGTDAGAIIPPTTQLFDDNLPPETPPLQGGTDAGAIIPPTTQLFDDNLPPETPPLQGGTDAGAIIPPTTQLFDHNLPPETPPLQGGTDAGAIIPPTTQLFDHNLPPETPPLQGGTDAGAIIPPTTQLFDDNLPPETPPLQGGTDAGAIIPPTTQLFDDNLPPETPPLQGGTDAGAIIPPTTQLFDDNLPPASSPIPIAQSSFVEGSMQGSPVQEAHLSIRRDDKKGRKKRKLKIDQVIEIPSDVFREGLQQGNAVYQEHTVFHNIRDYELLFEGLNLFNVPARGKLNRHLAPLFSRHQVTRPAPMEDVELPLPIKERRPASVSMAESQEATYTLALSPRRESIEVSHDEIHPPVLKKQRLDLDAAPVDSVPHDVIHISHSGLALSPLTEHVEVSLDEIHPPVLKKLRLDLDAAPVDSAPHEVIVEMVAEQLHQSPLGVRDKDPTASEADSESRPHASQEPGQADLAIHDTEVIVESQENLPSLGINDAGPLADLAIHDTEVIVESQENLPRLGIDDAGPIADLAIHDTEVIVQSQENLPRLGIDDAGPIADHSSASQSPFSSSQILELVVEQINKKNVKALSVLELYPPGTNRKKAVKGIFGLLELQKQQKIKMHQEREGDTVYPVTVKNLN